MTDQEQQLPIDVRKTQSAPHTALENCFYLFHFLILALRCITLVFGVHRITSCSIYQCPPWHNNQNNFLVWINEEDHTRVI
ncbi:unnamed protein product [Coregonus sp. 'balchen']|nr:unnamed protein product [Coregonus sp. 'balchen']